MNLEVLFRWVTALLITGAAVSELTQQPTVMTGLEVLGYPPTLVWIPMCQGSCPFSQK